MSIHVCTDLFVFVNDLNFSSLFYAKTKNYYKNVLTLYATFKMQIFPYNLLYLYNFNYMDLKKRIEREREKNI